MLDTGVDGFAITVEQVAAGVAVRTHLRARRVVHRRPGGGAVRRALTSGAAQCGEVRLGSAVDRAPTATYSAVVSGST
ncbi:hypothetical protein I4I84_28115, partial [Pseudonocardia sp. KRD-182]|nr:hypothetical protein [Pseudonocardia oceani]